MIIFYNCKWLGWYYDLVLWPFLFMREDEEWYKPVHWRHIMCHVAQQKRGLIVIYHLRYFYYHLVGWWSGLTWRQAYYINPFEVEAREAERI